MATGYDVDHEVKLVQYHIARIGDAQDDGTVTCTFGKLFHDEEAEQVFESLVGSLKAAKKRGICDFKGQILLMPVHKDVVITLKEKLPDGTVVDPPKPTDR
mmetsp:Transcript_4210/g.6356  ORF Transcript_4210/g.6356 Transcript_4210/m.6356 type:complete len:101 (-) Transcript_4210:43-345(-)|eukprot:CAMPEP_0201544232 /NCGR_PEP_ID=MMETSP0173_2-20130828/840_1 /ASSEMBLY_ACC=CAM_ASM_000268 /TAXON_ID=218659 /ORGANISM="Vexillifera sp., Strain DIVA3 564/2" /LENGTH=100 /DNA_ID=CAMNT_0047952277 /DNA_START=49 /DNA_END=351 /DNA_ORIENTATION=-